MIEAGAVRRYDVATHEPVGAPLEGDPNGVFGVAWSPDRAWLVVSWPQADQWVFIRVRGPHRIRAVSNVAQQFDGFPRLGAWCCPQP